MSGSKKLVLALAAICASAAAGAQDRPAGNAAADQDRTSDRQQVQNEEIDVQLRDAEEQLAEAAARIAELSRSRLPMIEIERRIMSYGRPFIGVTIGDSEDAGPVEGVAVQAVTPGGPAAEAGLRGGDIITAVNDESLSASSAREADRRLLDVVAAAKPGVTLAIEYLRDGKPATVTVKPRSMHGDDVLTMRPPGAPHAPMAPMAPFAPMFHFGQGGSWGDMEMVSLTANLGRYFGTDKGMLVVRAPEDDSLKLRDGDVIQRIDGREPSSVSHALRILGSYQGGEKLEIEIMREKKRQTISVQVPEGLRGEMYQFEFRHPDAAGDATAEPHKVGRQD